jgi:hypothetical protein
MNLEMELRRLVEEFGIMAVHDTLREAFDYCDNCGTPKSVNRHHSPASLGMCYVNEAGE